MELSGSVENAKFICFNTHFKKNGKTYFVTAYRIMHSVMRPANKKLPKRLSRNVKTETTTRNTKCLLNDLTSRQNIHVENILQHNSYHVITWHS